MTEAAEVFKVAWEKREAAWYDTFEDAHTYSYPTEPSKRTEAGLDAVAKFVLNKGVGLDDDVLGLPGFVEGVIYATRMMRGVEYP